MIMPDTGSPWALPYPVIGDAANGPDQIGALAAATDAALDTVNAKTVPGAILAGTSAFVQQTGWTLSAPDTQLFQVGALWFYRVTATRSGAAITVGTSGDISNSNVAQLVPTISPRMQFAASSAAAGRAASGAINPTGILALSAVAGGGVSIATGDVITLGGIFAV